MTAAVAPVSASTRMLLHAWYGLATLIFVSLMGNVIIRTILIISEPIKNSLSLTDTQIGSLNGGALTATTALATIPMGYLADKVDRRYLLAICVVIWSASTVAFGLSTSFPMLFMFAMGLAISEAVLGPITYAIIPDLFPREKWIIANFVFYIAVLSCFHVGIWASGLALEYLDSDKLALPAFLKNLESWRALMILCAATAPVLVVMLLGMRLQQPTGLREKQEPEARLLPYFRRHARSLAGVFIGFGLSYAAAGSQFFAVSLILPRLFGVTPAQMGQTIGLITLPAALIGVGTSYLAVRWARPRYGDSAPMLVAQWGLLAGLLVSLAYPFVQNAAQVYAIVAVKGAFTTMAMSLSPAVLQFLAPTELRGRVVAVGGMATVIFASVMPPVIGLLSDRVFTGHEGILWSMSIVIIPCLIVALAVLRWGAVTLPETIRAAAAGETAQ